MEVANEHLGIIEEALRDYRRWFEGCSASDEEYRKIIDRALKALS